MSNPYKSWLKTCEETIWELEELLNFNDVRVYDSTAALLAHWEADLISAQFAYDSWESNHANNDKA